MGDKYFNCDKCGVCCTKLNLSYEYRDLDSGNGICKFFNVKTRLCTIYESRPEKCNIIAMYKYFEKIMTIDEYIKVNKESCKRLKLKRR